jgi:hypothetical protein
MILAFIAAAGLGVPAHAQPAPPQPLLHIRTRFDLVVHAPYSVTAPLFGPNGERAWAGKHWKPEFIHPQPASPEAAADAEGAVFTVRHGPFNAVWVTSIFDVDGRHFQYVYFLPDLMVTVIDLRLNPLGPDSTGVNVVYTRTALTPEGYEHVAAMSEDDKTSGKDWQTAIDEYLAKSKVAVQH